MSKKNWIPVSVGDLADPRSWKPLGKETYAAVRSTLMIVETRLDGPYYGPAIHTQTVPPGATLELKKKRVQSLSQSATVVEGLKYVTTSKINDQITAKLFAEASSPVPGFSGKLGSEVLTKAEFEIGTSSEAAISATRTHSIQETTEEEHRLELKNPEAVERVAYFRRVYWGTRWDVYLHSFEYVVVSFQRKGLRPNSRSVLANETVKAGWPLGSLTIFEPQEWQDVTYERDYPKLEEPEGVHLSDLLVPMPSSVPPPVPEEQRLSEYVKQAFPTGTKERIEKIASSITKRRSAKKALRKTAARKSGGGYGLKPTARKAGSASSIKPETGSRKPSKSGARTRDQSKRTANRSTKGPIASTKSTAHVTKKSTTKRTPKKPSR